mgnify:FL=1
MKNSNNELALKRYSILKPYILKEKNLKEISEDTKISYSTLKRWASSYKKQGLNGLNKSWRSDKDTHRSLNQETINYIKKLYKENPNLKILDYYTKCLDFLKNIGEKVVSYDTIYRMINELNPYIHEFIPNNHISSKNSNEIFEIEYFQLDYYILDERDNILKRPYLNILYDNYSEIIYNFLITFEKITLYEIFSLLRNSILSFKEKNHYFVPQKLIINNLKFNNTEPLDNVKKKLNITINFSLGVENKLQDFFVAYNNHYLKQIFSTIKEPLSFSFLLNFTKNYIDENFKKFRINSNSSNVNILKKIKSESELDILLTPYKSKRKVKDGIIRFQNLLYEHPILQKYNDSELDIKYDPINLSKIKIYDFDFLVCELSSKTIEDYPLSYYELLSIKKIIRPNSRNNIKNLKNYSCEFRAILENRYTK